MNSLLQELKYIFNEYIGLNDSKVSLIKTDTYSKTDYDAQIVISFSISNMEEPLDSMKKFTDNIYNKIENSLSHKQKNILIKNLEKENENLKNQLSYATKILRGMEWNI